MTLTEVANLVGSYKRYTSDIHCSIRWLVKTAEIYNNIIPTKPNEISTVRITLRDFTLQSIAEVIVLHQIDVPPVILGKMKRAIALRKRCGIWYLGLEKYEHAIGACRHPHPITVLEEVCMILERKGAIPTKEAADPPPYELQDDDDESIIAWIRQQYAALGIEDTQPMLNVQPEEHDSAQYELEEDDDFKDMDNQGAPDPDLGSLLAPRTFHMFCLFDDLQSMRVFLRESWSEYLKGEIDLMNAAVITNIALGLAKGLITEFNIECKLAAETELLRLFRLLGRIRGENTKGTVDSGMPYNLELQDLATWCHLPAQLMLLKYVDNVPADSPELSKRFLQSFKNNLGRNHEAGNQREFMSPLGRFNEDRAILFQGLEVFSFLLETQQPFPITDEITKSLAQCLEHRKPSLWFAFVAQTFLDVNHTVRHKKSKPFNDLKVSALRVKKIIEEHQKFSKSFPDHSFWPKSADELIERIHNIVLRLIIDDYVLEEKQERFQERYWPTFEKHEHFKLNPVLCGLMMFTINIRMALISSDYISRCSTVLPLAHLYNLVQHTTKDYPSWADMNTFVGIHGEKRIFVDERPINVLQSSESFITATKSKQRFEAVLIPSVAVAYLLLRRCLASDPGEMGVPNIDAILSEAAQYRLAMSHDVSKACGWLQWEAWQRSHDIGRLQLLKAIKESMFWEEYRLTFDYFGMHRRCIEMMRLIRGREKLMFVPLADHGDVDDTQIGFMVERILHFARKSACDRADTPTDDIYDDDYLTSLPIELMLLNVTDAMEEYLAKYGDVACKELKVFCTAWKTDFDKMKDLEQGKRDVYWTCLEEVIDRDALAKMTGMNTG
ncbi:hypothetical protein BU16DRAFT_613108 [Lophium mytilinum]|uniref:DUF6604 domain-containing protein n=1 Tax=Lophium mytilinum TaxID=390894 RepID=A0A6A6R9Y4_9PEZI|nr:hypothetical protein BU16DRAFT_613108 [Lophium mytilinum]